MFRFKTHTIWGGIAAVAILCALLGGCDEAGPDPFAYVLPAATPLAQGGSRAESQGILPAPFSLTLPTPTNTPAAGGIPVLPTPSAAPGQSALVSPIQATPTTLPPATALVATATLAPDAGATPAVPPTAAAPPPPDVPAPPAVTPTPTPLSETPAPPTATVLPGAPGAPDATALPGETIAPTTTAPPTATAVPPTAGASPTPAATATRDVTQRPANTPTHTPLSPTPTPETTELPPITWYLAEDVIGMWEYEEDGLRTYFDFLDDGRVIVSFSGIWPYRVEDQHTLVIEEAGAEWPITVIELSGDRLTLADVVNETDHFYRVPGNPNLETEVVGLWIDDSGSFPSVEYTSAGVTIGDFGRGTYRTVSANSVLIECEDPETCSYYQEEDQGDPLLAVRILAVADERLTIQGFGYPEEWDLDHQPEQANLGADLIGLWEDDIGWTVEFSTDGTWIEDGERHGSYEVLSNTTVWGVQDGWGQALVVVELTADQLTYAEWGYFDEEDLWVYDRVEAP